MEKRPLVGVVADDLMCTGEIGLVYAQHGWVARLFTAEADLEALPRTLANERADVVVINTDARFDDSQTAEAKVRRATAALAHWGAEVFYAKGCAAGRGREAAYFDAMLAELGHDFGIAVVAVPTPGRVSVDGMDVERLPLAIVRSGAIGLLHHIDDARKRHVRYLCADIENEDDLGALAVGILHEPVVLGSSAVAEELAFRWRAPESFDPFGAARPVRKGGVLVLAGSTLPETRAQVAAMEAAGLQVVTLTAATSRGPLMTAVAHHLQQGAHVVVCSEQRPATLAAFAETACGRIVVLGMETSAAVCRHLGVEEMVVVDALAPGLPCCYAVHPSPVLLVLTSGAYGGPDFGLQAIAHLEGLCHDRWR